MIRLYDYTETNNVDPEKLNQDLDQVNEGVTVNEENLDKIQRSDGELEDEIVKIHTLDPEVKSLFSNDGEQGIQGEQGTQGETGPQGEQGIQGDPGPEGPEGPAGTDGTDGADGGIQTITIEDSYLAGEGTDVSPLGFSQNTKDALNFFIGSTLDPIVGVITSDGTTITALLEKVGGGDIRYITDGAVNVIDSTPTASVVLTAGSDDDPITNYIYILNSTNTLESSTTFWPTTETFTPLATTLLGSASFVQTDGPYNTENWNNHVHLDGENGQMSKLNSWIRSQHATWIDGNTIAYTGNVSNTLQLAVSSGVMLQLGIKATAGIANPATFYIVNDENTPYLPLNNIADITTDTTGDAASGNGRFMALVVWYSYSSLTGQAKLFINKAATWYKTESDVREDIEKASDFSIPEEFKGTAVLLQRLVYRNYSNGNAEIIDGAGDDLRGSLPNTASGSSTVISYNANRFNLQFTLPVGADGTYTLLQSSNFGFTIEQADFQTSSGTITAGITIDNTNVTGLTGMGLTTTAGTAPATAANLVDEGGRVQIALSANNIAGEVSLSLDCIKV